MLSTNSALEVSDILANILKKTPCSSRCFDIFSRWTDIVDSKTAQLTVPYKITTNQRNEKVLIVKAKKGFALQVLHNSINILNSVNEFFKEPVFKQVKVIQAE